MELLGVILIIAVLAAVIQPALNHAYEPGITTSFRQKEEDRENAEAVALFYRYTCTRKLREIEAGKSEAIDFDSLTNGVFCPAGGSYSPGNLSVKARCDVEGHSL